MFEKKDKGKAPSFSVFHIIVICTTSIIAFTIIMIASPYIADAIELWQIRKDNQTHINTCGFDKEEEANASAVFCPTTKP